MDNITKTKLINSLIDAVSHFYDLKQKDDDKNQKHIKGFCEGMAYTLVEIKAIKSDEAKRILQGLGKKLEEIKTPLVKEQEKEKDIPLEIKEKQEEKNDLEVPTIFRKNIDKQSNPLE